MPEQQDSDKSFVATLILCLLLGSFGVHRFYVGKIGMGIIMLLTLGDLAMAVDRHYQDSYPKVQRQ